MPSEFVTRWLEERKPGWQVTYLGPSGNVYLWDLGSTDTEHTFRLGIMASVVRDEALLAERLMELETQGWLDQAGEKDLWVLVAPAEVAEGPSLFRGGAGPKP